MILGAIAMIAANAAAILGANSLLKFVRVGRPATDFVLFLLLRLLLISSVVLIVGAAGGLSALVLGLAGAVALGLLLARGAHRGLRRPRLEGGERWILVLAALVALRLLLQVWFFSPYLGDTLSYHLPKVAEWVRAGGFTGELGPDPRAAFPAGFELIETWWVVFLHHDALIEMAGVEFLILAAASAWALAREAGWSIRSASIAAFAFVLTPGLHLQATSCLNDGPVASLVVSTAALVVARAHPVVLLLPVGLGLGVKGTFAYALPGLAVTAWLCRRDPAAPLPSLRTASIVAGAAAAAGAVWYLRNWALFGSPIHPMGIDGMKSAATGSTLQRLGPSLQALRENLACFLDIRIYDHLNAPDGLGAGNFNGGAAAFAVGAPALVAVLRTEAPIRRLSAGLVLSALTIFALVSIDPWYARFVLFLALPPALALGRLWERHRLVAVLGALALAAELLSTCVPGSLPRESLRRMAREGAAVRASTPPPPGAGPTVAYCAEDFGAGYLLYGAGYSRRVIYLREESLDGLLSRLRREGLPKFYAADALRRRAAPIDEGLRLGRLRPFTDGDWKGYEVVGEK